MLTTQKTEHDPYKTMAASVCISRDQCDFRHGQNMGKSMLGTSEISATTDFLTREVILREFSYLIFEPQSKSKEQMK